MRVGYIGFVAGLALTMTIMPCQGQGTISTVAGSGTGRYSGDGASLISPRA